MNFFGVAARVLQANQLVGRPHLRISVRTVGSLPRLAAASATSVLNPELSLDPNVLPSSSLSHSAAASATSPSKPELNPDPDFFASSSLSYSADEEEFWRKIPVWKDVPAKDFLSYRWSVFEIVQGKGQLVKFLERVLPSKVPFDDVTSQTQTREEFIADVEEGMKTAAMAVRMTPYVLSRINWTDPRNDPIFKQFIPLKSRMIPNHPMCGFDSLGEIEDSPVDGLVHRYPDKALFLPIKVCPTYCMFCTRSYAVGADTETLTKDAFKPTLKLWNKCFAYIESQPGLHDIVISGGDSYYLTPEHLRYIGARLLGMPNIKRIRFASKGLAVAPARILDKSDGWTDALIGVSNMARRLGKTMALHTHFNHANEISWITRKASQKLLEAGVLVRNQTVLLRGINDSVEAMGALISSLADANIFPYYVYQCDLVKTIEHLRTPLQTILDIEAQLRGTIAGFMMPQFVVDLPGGGGKRLAHSHQSYDRTTGVSTYTAPAVTGKPGRNKANRVYEYWDPLDSLVAVKAPDQSEVLPDVDQDPLDSLVTVKEPDQPVVPLDSDQVSAETDSTSWGDGQGRLV